jgi:thymidylate kinase
LPSATDVAQREAAFSKPGVSKVWLAAAILDTYLVYVIGVRVLSAMGRVVICDRFVEDAILDLQLRFPEVKIAELKSIRSLRALAPKARLSVLLVIDWTEMLRRMEEKQEPFPDTPSIRERRFAAYLDLRDQGIYTVIDASRSPEEIFDEIAAHLDSRR